ncbi:MAG: hypothetical protein KAT05_08555 [Spirochaetes bacterium]|nr:hypothetical protein [Spirochaetota bacterium]
MMASYLINSMEKSFSPEEWVLIFFYAGADNSDQPTINGFLMFTKQFFVFVKEINKFLDEYFNFIPYDYGPYSFVLKNDIDNISKKGFIEIKKYEDRQDFILTESGIKKSRILFDRVDEKTKESLQNLRREATELGYRGVLRYVYSRYPEYTTASKIRERVLDGS